MASNDFQLTIEDVSKRLNKSVRTVHRYKDSGKLSFILGNTKGNPLFFSRAEVEDLARQLYPNSPEGGTSFDPKFWERLEKVEQMIAVFEKNPFLEQLINKPNGQAASLSDLELAMQQLALLESNNQDLDRQALGRLLVRIGNALLGG